MSSERSTHTCFYRVIVIIIIIIIIGV